MRKLNVDILKEGMILAKPIFDPKTSKLLLNSCEVLTNYKINILKKKDINFINVLDEFTITLGMKELIKKDLENNLNKLILTLAPQSVESSGSTKMIKVSKLAQKSVAKITENEEILNFCIEMKLSNSKFLYAHSISVAAFSLLIAGAMDLSEQEILEIGSAALLHDLGFIEMPIILSQIDKQMKNSIKENDIMEVLDIAKGDPAIEQMWHEHPVYGYYLCNEKGISNENIRNIIFHHHEDWNGGGFPDGLKGNDIPLGSRIIRLCDMYDRLIRSNKCFRYQAIETLYSGGGFFFDSEIVNIFTNNISVYPIGSIVRLTTGETGVVVNIKKNKGPRPIVRVYYNRVNKPLSHPKEIDLGVDRTIFIKEIL